MKLLIHACCADCLLHLLETLKTNDADVGVYFYNPNIHPQSEYFARLFALKKVLANMPYKLIVPHWKPSEYFDAIGKNCEKKISCPNCWHLRLKSAFNYAKENNYEAVATTMLTSHYLDREKIARMGQKLAKQYGLKFIVPEKRDSDLKTRGFYKQNYCGCIFSLNERFGEKYKLINSGFAELKDEGEFGISGT